MNQNEKRIVEGELAKYMKQYIKAKDDFDFSSSSSFIDMAFCKDRIKQILFDLWENGDITIGFN